MNDDLRIIRIKELAELLDVSQMTLWRWQKAGTFPRALKLGANTRGWSYNQVRAWLDARTEPPAGSWLAYFPRSILLPLKLKFLLLSILTLPPL